ncbi:hypothetical protein L596_012570 [Steinernema carpocapsae]|uniref:Uncharacterized protein n=1 Tax=Steinernema carpocapsae TaxID=34508 RepID=A0A4U5NY30_STECR|nr:hypothetical protein L596_012570 [Steinernema carpocapsae]
MIQSRIHADDVETQARLDCPSPAAIFPLVAMLPLSFSVAQSGVVLERTNGKASVNKAVNSNAEIAKNADKRKKTVVVGTHISATMALNLCQGTSKCSVLNATATSYHSTGGPTKRPTEKQTQFLWIAPQKCHQTSFETERHRGS